MANKGMIIFSAMMILITCMLASMWNNPIAYMLTFVYGIIFLSEGRELIDEMMA